MAAGGSGGELARPEPTGYGHTDSEWVDDTGTSDPRGDLRHVNVEKYEPLDWPEARDERHRQPGRRQKTPADEFERLKPEPGWNIRTEAKMSGWKNALFGPAITVEELDLGADGVVRYKGRPVAARHQDMFVVVPADSPMLAEAVGELAASARKRGLKVGTVDTKELEVFIMATGGERGQSKPRGEGEQSMSAKTKRMRRAKSNGIAAGHKKIIDELLVKEDAKPTGDVVRLAESNTRKEFARYQIPTDRGLKDIEIWGDRVKVRSEATYGFAKSAQDDMDGLPDRVAPVSPNGVPDVGPDPSGDEIPVAVDDLGEVTEDDGGLPLRVDISVNAPDGMEEEEVISILDEILRDPDVASQLNDLLADSGLSLSVLEVDTYDDADDDEDFEDEDFEGEDDEALEGEEGLEVGELSSGSGVEVVDPAGPAVQESRSI